MYLHWLALSRWCHAQSIVLYEGVPKNRLIQIVNNLVLKQTLLTCMSLVQLYAKKCLLSVVLKIG